MSVWRAVFYRLFAASDKPKRTLAVRTIVALIGMGVVGVLSYRYAPIGYTEALGFTPVRTVALLYLFVLTLVGAITVLLAPYLRTFLSRIELFHTMALSQAQLKGVYAAAFLPVLLLALFLVGPAASTFATGGSLSVAWLLADAVIVLVTTAAAAGVGMSTRLLAGYGILTMSLGLIAGWQLYTTTAEWPLLFVAGLLFAQLACLAAWLQPVRPRHDHISPTVHEYHDLWLDSAMALRALRSRRYRSTNLVAAGLLAVLAILGWQRPDLLPFDGVVFLGLLLTGSIAQEARSLSPRFYPLELVRFGLLRKWLVATWKVAILNALLFLVVLFVAAVAFPGTLGITYGQALCIGLGLIAAGIGVGSAVSPGKGDLLAQLAATGLYLAVAWLVLRLPAVAGSLLPIYTALLVLTVLFVAYRIERRRWIKTIWGDYA